MSKDQNSKLMSVLAKGLRHPNGKLNWRVTGSAIYAVLVWTAIGGFVASYKLGYLKLDSQSGANDSVTDTLAIDGKERTRIRCEEVAENLYASETFIG